MYHNDCLNDITNVVPAEQVNNKRCEQEDALTCKSCGAPLSGTKCSYCGTYSWIAAEYFWYGDNYGKIERF